MNEFTSKGRRLWPALAIFISMLLLTASISSVTTSPDLAAVPAIYWTDLTASAVFRANLDGSQIEEVLITDGGASAITIDQAAGEMIYWAPDFQLESMIWRAGLDGSDLRPAFLGLPDYYYYWWDWPLALGLDGKNRDLYWASPQPYYYDESATSIIRGSLENGDLGLRLMPGPIDPRRYAEEQPDLELDSSAGLFYWSDADGIRRTLFDGIEAKAVLVNNIEKLYPLQNTPFALDNEAGKIYYVAGTWEYDRENEIVLARADLDTPWKREELLVAADYMDGQIMDVAVDTLHDKLYWSIRGRETAIRRANLDGSGVETIVDQVLGPQGLVLDPAAGKIYWADWLVRKIQRANLDGSGLEDLVDTAPMRPRFLHLNIAEQEIYWTGRGGGRVWQAPMAGGDFTLLVSGDSDNTGGIAYDPFTDSLFWTDTAGQLVTRSRSDGTDVRDVLYPRVNNARGLFVEEETGKIVWFDLGVQAIKRANLDGSETETLLTGDFGEATSLAWDPLRRSFCWADPILQHIACAGWNGENRHTILSEEDGVRRPNVLAIDARSGHVYWTDWGTMSLHRANLDGSQMVDIVSGGLHEPSGLALSLEPLQIERTYLPLVSGPVDE